MCAPAEKSAIFDRQLQPQHLDSHFHPHIYTFYFHIRSWQAPAVPQSHMNASRHRYKKLLNVLQKGDGEEKYPNKDCAIVIRYVLQAMYPWMGLSYVCLNSSNPDTNHKVMVKDWKLHRSSVQHGKQNKQSFWDFSKEALSWGMAEKTLDIITNRKIIGFLRHLAMMD